MPLPAVNSLVFRKLTDNDFFYITKSPRTERLGGGGSYIDISTSAVSIEMWRRFFRGIPELSEYNGPGWKFNVFSLGSVKGPQEIVIAQRRASTVSIRSQKLLSRAGNRVYAWLPELTNFPKPIDPRKREHIEDLCVYIVRLANDEFWAGWFQSRRPKPGWDISPTIDQVFSLREGYLEFGQGLYFNSSNADWPFSNSPVQQTRSEEVDVVDDTEAIDKRRIIALAKTRLSSDRGRVVVERPKIDMNGLFRPTSEYVGPMSSKHHVKLEYSTKIGRGLNLSPRPMPGCAGRIVYVEKGYEGYRSDSQLVTFSTRMRGLVKAIRGNSDGPNPDNIRILMTHASTDAKILPVGDIIGFNAIDDAEPDSFWVMAAAREAAYLKFTDRYRHLRLMTELVVRGFTNLGMIKRSNTPAE